MPSDTHLPRKGCYGSPQGCSEMFDLSLTVRSQCIYHQLSDGACFPDKCTFVKCPDIENTVIKEKTLSYQKVARKGSSTNVRMKMGLIIAN